MPTYSYACRDCEHRFDIQQAFSDNSLTTCPVCAGSLRKVFSAVGVVFKGSGFYRNDSRSGSGASSSSANAGSSSESNSSDKSGGSTEKGSADKPAAKSSESSSKSSAGDSSNSSSSSSGSSGQAKKTPA